MSHYSFHPNIVSYLTSDLSFTFHICLIFKLNKANKINIYKKKPMLLVQQALGKKWTLFNVFNICFHFSSFYAIASPLLLADGPTTAQARAVLPHIVKTVPIWQQIVSAGKWAVRSCYHCRTNVSTLTSHSFPLACQPIRPEPVLYFPHMSPNPLVILVRKTISATKSVNTAFLFSCACVCVEQDF